MRTVLLVDDEIEVLESVASMLAPLGWDLVRCRNGDDAAALAREQRFDVVLSDVVMEGLVGTALLEAIHGGAANRSTPVVFMSNMIERRVRQIVEGDYAFIHKPFTVRELSRTLEDVLGDRARGGSGPCSTEMDGIGRHRHPGR